MCVLSEWKTFLIFIQDIINVSFIFFVSPFVEMQIFSFH